MTQNILACAFLLFTGVVGEVGVGGNPFGDIVRAVGAEALVSPEGTRGLAYAQDGKAI